MQVCFLSKLSLLLANVIALDFEASLNEVACHGLTHVSKADEADFLAPSVRGRK